MRQAWATMALVVAGAVVGLMGTDLVLPAVPLLPEALNAGAPAAQLVLAAYVGGTCVGLLAFGALSERFATQRLFVGSLVATAAASLACAAARSVETLIALRALQGAVAAAPAVFAPAIVKALFDERQAVRAMGLLGSIESLAPALAPIVGAGLLFIGDWRLSFLVLAVAAGALGLLAAFVGRIPQVGQRAKGGYAALLRNATFLRYALSQAFVLGGLLTFVLGLPAVLVRVLGGTLGDFIVVQVVAILLFIASANLSAPVVARLGTERTIILGTALCLLGSGGQLAYALAGGTAPLALLALFAPVNIGLGLRGPPGFYRAVVAARGDDARGAALVVLAILGVAATGTVLASPFIERGTAPLAAVALLLHAVALACLVALPKLAADGEASA